MTQSSETAKKPKKVVPAPSPNAKVLTNAQAADRLGVSTKTLGRWRQVKGAGPPFMKPSAGKRPNSNTHVRYPLDSLDDWIKDNSWASPLHKMRGWVVDAQGRVTRPALPDERGDDVIIASIHEALTEEKWASRDAMIGAWEAWRSEMTAAEEEIRQSIADFEREELADEVAGRGRHAPKKKSPLI